MKKLILILALSLPCFSQTNIHVNNIQADGTLGVTGVSTLSGGVVTRSMNASTWLFVDQLAGADFCVKMNACEAAMLAVGGGICDARALTAAQSCSVTWGASTNQVRHLIGDMTLNCGTLNPCITWSANGANLEGASWNNTIFSTASGTADIIKVTAVGAQNHFSNFKTTASVVRTAGAALHIQGGNNTWERIWMEPTFNGVVLDTAGTGGNNFFDKMEIQGGGSGAAWNCGVLVGGVAINNVASNQFHHLAFLSNGPAFADAQFCIQDGADSTTIESSMFVANVGGADATGLHIERINGGNAPSNTKISDLTIEGGVTKTGIIIDSANGVDFTGGTVQTSLKGLLVNAGTRITWEGGLFFNNQNEGVRVAALDALGAVTIANTRFGNNGQAANNTWDDVFVAAAVGNFTLNANTFLPVIATAVLPKYNIEIAAGASDFYSIMGNTFPAGSFFTNRINDAGTGLNKVLCNAVTANATILGCQGWIINSSGLTQIGGGGPYFSTIRAAMGSGTSAVWTSTAANPNNAAPDTGISVVSPGLLAIGNGAITAGDFSGGLKLTTISAAGQITSTLATGTPPLVIASTTNVPNLNASSLSGATFASPGAIGGTVASTGKFTTVQSTQATGTAPLTIASTTPVANLSINGGGTVDGDVIGGVTPAAGSFTTLTGTTHKTTTNCAVNSASPAACGSAAAGVVAVPTLTTTYIVNTTAVTANSRIFLQPTSDNTGIPSSPTCATLAVTAVNMVSARVAGTSFTFSLPSTTGITCFGYWIVN